MKNSLFILFLLFCFVSCEDYSHTKTYEFSVENQLDEGIVKIVPKSKSGFWITSNDNYNYIALSREIIVIGSKIISNNEKKATDIYKPDDIIEPFDLYIDDIKQEKSFSLRKYWEFSIGKVNESGKYILIINENTLKD
jgi:hypothetical protein